MNIGLVYFQPYSNQNNVYPQYSSTMHLPAQNLIQNGQRYPSYTHSTQDTYPTSPQTLYPQHHQSDSLPPSS